MAGKAEKPEGFDVHKTPAASMNVARLGEIGSRTERLDREPPRNEATASLFARPDGSADAKPQEPHVAAPRRQSPLAQHFATADADGNGALSQAEARAFFEARRVAEARFEPSGASAEARIRSVSISFAFVLKLSTDAVIADEVGKPERGEDNAAGIVNFEEHQATAQDVATKISDGPGIT